MKRRKSVPGPAGEPVEGVAVPVVEATERFSDVSLADGTILTIKPVVVEAVRLDDEWDQEGYPKYIVKTAQVISVVSSSDKIMKKSR